MERRVLTDLRRRFDVSIRAQARPPGRLELYNNEDLTKFPDSFYFSFLQRMPLKSTFVLHMSIESTWFCRCAAIPTYDTAKFVCLDLFNVIHDYGGGYIAFESGT